MVVEDIRLAYIFIMKFTSVSRGAILRCCKGKVKRAGNFIWRYYGKGI